MVPAVKFRGGFSVAEILLALALVSVAILTLLGLSLRSLQMDRKSGDLVAGQLVAEQILERLCYEAERNSTGPIWNASVPSPYSVDLVSAGGSDFRITTYVTDVIDAASSFTAGRRLRQLRSVVEWSDAPQGKAGEGRLRISATRLIHEP